MPFSEGIKLGPCEILARIVESGMSEVCRAKDITPRGDQP